jgi:hypothetical protein
MRGLSEVLPGAKHDADQLATLESVQAALFRQDAQVFSSIDGSRLSMRSPVQALLVTEYNVGEKFDKEVQAKHIFRCLSACDWRVDQFRLVCKHHAFSVLLVAAQGITLRCAVHGLGGIV